MDEEGRQDLSPYLILYNVTNDTVPFTSDYIAVVNLTDVYLRDYFIKIFSGVNFATLDFFETMAVNAEYRRGEPIQMEYNSTAFFDTDSLNIPSTLDLDVLLKQAFQGQNGENYTLLLQDYLNETNPFSTTTSVQQMIATTDSAKSETQSRILAATLTSVAAVTALVAIGIFVRRKKRRRHREDKSIVHGHFSFSFNGSDTLADETFALSTIVELPEGTRRPVQSVSYDNNVEYASLEDSATYTSDSCGERRPYRTQSFDSESSFETIDPDRPETALESTQAFKEPQEETCHVSGSDEEAPPQGETTSVVEQPQQEEITSATGAEESPANSIKSAKPDESKGSISGEPGEVNESSSAEGTVPTEKPSAESSKADV